MEQANKDFTASDAMMSRCISTAISLLWSEEQIKEKGEKMVNVIKKVLSEQTCERYKTIYQNPFSFIILSSSWPFFPFGKIGR